LKVGFTRNAGDFRPRFDFFILFSRFNRGESPGEGVQPARDVTRRTLRVVGISDGFAACGRARHGTVEIVLISRHVEPSDLNSLSSLGIDPMQKRYVMLKSRIHWRAGLGKLARGVVDCAGVGVCTSDYGQLKFEKVRRPIYPLDLPNR
jgi:microcystin degradation protein MlrC